MRKGMKQVLAALLALTMLFGAVGAFAEEDTEISSDDLFNQMDEEADQTEDVSLDEHMDTDTDELTEEEKRALCSIAREVRPDFIKTSTGFGTGGATFEDVALMKKCVGDEVKIKAAGGIRTLNTALRMIELGVSRIGSTASVSIIEELKHRL